MKFMQMFGLARERLPKLGVLRGDADRAGIQVALAHHDAAEGDQRDGAESELLGAEQRADRPRRGRCCICPSTCTRMRSRSRFMTSVCWVSARPISHGMPAYLIDESGEAPGAAVVAADEHHVGLSLRDARGDGAHADLGDELYRDAGVRVRVLEVEDELGKVFDGVDVVVRRRRDEHDARAWSGGPWR